MKKRLFYIFFLCAVAMQVFAQTDSIPRAAPESVAAPKSVLTLGAIYGNTENYYGQSPVDRLPYVLLYTGYKLKNGLSLSATAEKLLNSGSGIAVLDIYAGYGFNITKKLTANAGYIRYFYQKDSPLLETAANENSLTSSLTYSWIMKSGINVNYAFGTQGDLFISFRNSKMLDLGSLFSDKDYISLEPAVDIIGSTGHFYDNYTVRINDRRQARNLPPRPPPPPVDEASTFSILSYVISLPLGFNRASYTIEATYQASIQGQKISSESNKLQSIFNLGFYYAF